MVYNWLGGGLLIGRLIGKNKTVYPRQEFISLCHDKLLLKFGANYKIAVAALATFHTFSAKMKSKFFKCYEWRSQGLKRRFRKPKHTKEQIKKDSNRYFVEKFRNLLTYAKFMLWIFQSVVFAIRLKRIKKHYFERNLSPGVWKGNQMVNLWNQGIISLAFCTNCNNFPSL